MDRAYRVARVQGVWIKNDTLHENGMIVSLESCPFEIAGERGRNMPEH
jgi:hypothetical protein